MGGNSGEDGVSADRSSPFITRLVGRAGLYSKFVRFAHSIFALPFALAGLALATTEAPFRWDVLGWVVVAMVAARSAAMGFNRIVDRKLDLLNPRTAGRELPQNKISMFEAWAFVLASSAVFVLAAFMLNWLCALLSPVALATLFFYSLTKRLTWTSQFFLGLSLAIAPAGAWVALTGTLDWRIMPLFAAVLLWVTGFDIFYSLLDLEFDREHGLRSVPGRWGATGGILIARLLHATAAVLLLSLFWLFDLGVLYLVGTAGVALLLGVEDLMVNPRDTTRVLTAFNLNGFVSILYLLAVVGGLAWR